MLSFSSAAFTADPPTIPGQPNIKHTIRKPTEAQERLQSGRPGLEVALAVREAKESLEKSINNKGSFRATAIRLTGQAIKHLEKDDNSTVTLEIERAIEAANKAGEAAARSGLHPVQFRRGHPKPQLVFRRANLDLRHRRFAY